jgi:hypothetical protein
MEPAPIGCPNGNLAKVLIEDALSWVTRGETPDWMAE